MTVDSARTDEIEHEEVHKSGDVASCGVDGTAAPPADDEDLAASDEEDILREADSVAEADGEDMNEEALEEVEDEENAENEQDEDWEEPKLDGEDEDAEEDLEGADEDAQEEAEEELEAEGEEDAVDAEAELEEEAEEDADEEEAEEEFWDEEDEEEMGDVDAEEEELEAQKSGSAKSSPQQKPQQDPVRRVKQVQEEYPPIAKASRQWGVTKQPKETFTVGQQVHRRDKGEAWAIGFVTSADPLKVTESASDPAAKGHAWHEVRHVSSDQSGAAAASASGSQPSSPAGGAEKAGRAGAKGAAAQSGGSAGQKSYAQLAEENRQLRVELGQAKYKVQQLSKLREQATESQRREMLARQTEARASKELELAKEYVGKRDTHSRNEKAELLQKIKHLEDVVDRTSNCDKNMQAELAEATLYRQEAFQHVEEAQHATEKWRADAIEQAKKVKEMENRVTQLQDIRKQDKARMRELATLLQAQQTGKTQHTNSDAAPASDSSPEKVLQKPASGNKSSNGNRKGDDFANTHGKSLFEDPIKPVKGSSTLSSGEESQGFFASALERLRGGSREAASRGKGKKGGRVGGAVAVETAASPQEARQQLVLGALIVIIVGLAGAKLTFA